MQQLPVTERSKLFDDEDGYQGDYAPDRRAFYRLAKERADRVIDEAEKQYFASHPNERPKSYNHDVFDLDEIDEMDDDDEEEEEKPVPKDGEEPEEDDEDDD